MKNLEKFVKENSSKFDQLEPGSDLWSRIDADLSHERSTGQSGISIFWKVAAVLLLFSTSWLLFDKFSGDQQYAEQTVAGGEFAEAEKYYNELILQKRNELVKVKIEDGSLSSEFLQEIDRLDSIYSGLKNELLYNQSNERIQDAMIINLQLRLNILNQQLEILERLKKLKSDENIST